MYAFIYKNVLRVYKRADIIHWTQPNLMRVWSEFAQLFHCWFNLIFASFPLLFEFNEVEFNFIY